MPPMSAERGAPSMLAHEVYAHPARFSRVSRLSLRRMPLLCVAAAFAGGVCAAHWCWRPAALLVAGTACMAVLAAAAVRWAPRVAAGAVLLLWLLLGWTVAVLHPRAVVGRALPYTDGLRREAVATVVALQPFAARSAPREGDAAPRFGEEAADQEPASTEPGSYSADLQLQQVEAIDPDVFRFMAASGRVRVTLPAADGAHLQCGDVVHATVRLYRPREFRDPGVWQYGQWLAQQEVTATGTVVPRHVLWRQTGPAPWACRLQQVRAWAGHRLRDFAVWQRGTGLPPVLRWSENDVAAWSAMLFGDRTALTHSLRANFERTGTFHLFVVSGMHIGLVASLVFWLAERARCGRVLAALLTAAVTAAYALLTGFGEPVQRALFMTVVFLFAHAIGRERNALNAIGAALLAMLLLRPQALFDSSLQMTALIALTIAGIAAPLLERTIAPYARACRKLEILRFDRRLPPPVAQFRVRLRWLVMELEQVWRGWRGRWAGRFLVLLVRGWLLLLSATLVALVTELTMALPMALYFHRYTTLALPANLLVMPLLAPLMVCGILAFLLCLIAYPLAMVLAVPAALLLHMTNGLVHALASLHGADLRTPGPSLAAATLLACVVGASLVLLRLRRPVLGWSAAVCLCGVAAGTVLLARRVVPPAALQVTAIDVGQGDSILLTAPDGQELLVDAGGLIGPETQANAFDIGEEVVSPYLWQRGVRRLEVVLLTHADMDHLGGMDAVVRNFRPRELWLSVENETPRLQVLLRNARSAGVAVRFVRAGAHVTWHGVSLDAMSPPPGYQSGPKTENGDSVVLRAGWGRASALLTGDAEQPSEQAMLDAHLLGPVTLLKVGHHGSLTSTSEPFLDALQPRYAVISCGRGNPFGHPRMPVLARLEERHAWTARTDTMGVVEYTMHGDGTVTVNVPGAPE